MARPKKEPGEDFKETFEKLCGLQCTKEEIQDWFDISEKTLDRWVKDKYGEKFADVYKSKRNKGKASLRRAQFKLAHKSAAMAIWLGKQWLGQKETNDTDEITLLRLDELLKEVRQNAQKESNNEIHD